MERRRQRHSPYGAKSLSGISKRLSRAEADPGDTTSKCSMGPRLSIGKVTHSSLFSLFLSFPLLRLSRERRGSACGRRCSGKVLLLLPLDSGSGRGHHGSMSDETSEKPDPIEDVRKGLGLLF